jgi:hypothetical protein
MAEAPLDETSLSASDDVTAGDDQVIEDADLRELRGVLLRSGPGTY